ncbi:MAG: hypothetical protein LQ339_004910 [Xanthoria mediterranea]|nr:MAG: hypothetical protein LQ339_004910 [Xanthoria mediterranea]
MSPLSTITTLPLLFLLTLPFSVLSAPAPAPQTPAAGTDEILPQYKITFAELNSSRTEMGGTVGLDSILNITVSGVERGNLPVNCLGEWFFPQGTPLNYVELNCTDKNVLVNLNQVGGEHAGVQIAVGVSVEGQDGARARWGTNTSNATEWACEGAVGGVCRLILPEVRIDSVSLKGPMVPAKAGDGKEET